MQRWADVRIKFADEAEEKVPKPRVRPLDRDAKALILCLCTVIVAQAGLIMSERPPAWWLWLPITVIISYLGWEVWRE